MPSRSESRLTPSHRFTRLLSPCTSDLGTPIFIPTPLLRPGDVVIERGGSLVALFNVSDPSRCKSRATASVISDSALPPHAFDIESAVLPHVPLFKTQNVDEFDLDVRAALRATSSFEGKIAFKERKSSNVGAVLKTSGILHRYGMLGVGRFKQYVKDNFACWLNIQRAEDRCILFITDTCSTEEWSTAIFESSQKEITVECHVEAGSDALSGQIGVTARRLSVKGDYLIGFFGPATAYEGQKALTASSVISTSHDSVVFFNHLEILQIGPLKFLRAAALPNEDESDPPDNPDDEVDVNSRSSKDDEFPLDGLLEIFFEQLVLANPQATNVLLDKRFLEDIFARPELFGIPRENSRSALIRFIKEIASKIALEEDQVYYKGMILNPTSRTPLGAWKDRKMLDLYAQYAIDQCVVLSSKEMSLALALNDVEFAKRSLSVEQSNQPKSTFADSSKARTFQMPLRAPSPSKASSFDEEPEETSFASIMPRHFVTPPYNPVRQFLNHYDIPNVAQPANIPAFAMPDGSPMSLATRQILQDLENRVVDWKGHDLRSFGKLQLYDVIQVQRKTAEREYRTYLFDRILIFCKVIKVPPKSLLSRLNITNNPSGKNLVKDLQLKGRLFISNVLHTQIVESFKGSAWLRISWRDDQLQIDTLDMKLLTIANCARWRSAIEGARARSAYVEATQSMWAREQRLIAERAWEAEPYIRRADARLSSGQGLYSAYAPSVASFATRSSRYTTPSYAPSIFSRADVPEDSRSVWSAQSTPPDSPFYSQHSNRSGSGNQPLSLYDQPGRRRARASSLPDSLTQFTFTTELYGRARDAQDVRDIHRA